jgi:hypothetical protein
MLAKYYPMEIQMNSFDTGSSAAAKKNNWSILERVFTKYSIPITRDLYNQVSNCQQRATTILLTILFSHIHSKSHNSDGVMITSLNVLQTKRDLGYFKQMGSMADLKEEHEEFALKAEKASRVSMPTEQEDQLGKLMLVKTICSLFGLSDQAISFYRSSYQGGIVREMICQHIDSNPQDFRKDVFAKELESNYNDISQYLAHVTLIEFQAVLDTFLPVLVHYGPLSNTFQGNGDLFSCVQDAVLRRSNEPAVPPIGRDLQAIDNVQRLSIYSQTHCTQIYG